MTNLEATAIELQCDTSSFEKSTEAAMMNLRSLEQVAENVCKSITDSFNPIIDGLKEIQTEISTAVDTVVSAATEEVGPFDGIISSIGGLAAGSDAIQSIETLGEAINKGAKYARDHKEDFNIFKAIIPESLAASDALKGVMSKGISDLMGDLNGKFTAFAPTLVQSGNLLSTTFGTAFGGISAGWGLLVAGIIVLIVYLIAHWDEVCLKVQEVFAYLQGVFARFSEFIATQFATDWTQQFASFGYVINSFWAVVQGVWTMIKGIFSGIITFIKGVFSGDWEAAWDGITQIFRGIWDGMKTIVTGAIDAIRGVIDGLIEKIAEGLQWVRNLFSFNSSSGKSIDGTTGDQVKPTIRTIPQLAQGAVLSANRPFLAVVGDQRHGTNVEAPLSTIQAAVAEVMARQGTGDINITFTGDLAQLGRVLKPVIERENRRVGGSLAKGYTKMQQFLLDGVAYNVSVTKLSRKFSIMDAEGSGRTQNGEMYRDFVGTFYYSWTERVCLAILFSLCYNFFKLCWRM